MLHKSCWVIVLLLSALSVSADVTLPRILGNDVVLQRDSEIPVWGWADPGEEVSVSMAGNDAQTTASADGKWEVALPALPAGGPYDIDVRGRNSITVKNVLMGDVWVCSGQSNMELPMNRMQERYAAELASCANPAIRQFTSPMAYDFKAPCEDFDSGAWMETTPENALNFSGVAFFYAKELNASLGVPIGIINSSNGGSPINSWLSEEALGQFPESLKEALRWRDDALIKQTRAHDENMDADWYGTLDRSDPGLAKRREWYGENLDTTDWKTFTIPGKAKEQGLDSVGSTWLRKEIDLPPELAGLPAKLRLGTIIEADSAYVNGRLVGSTSYQYPPRRYNVPAGALKAGRNVITIRVTCPNGAMSFVQDKPYVLEAGGQSFDLKGEWLCKIGAVMPEKDSITFIRWKPLGLHNGMIGPLTRLHIKGVLWYQGESDTWQASRYGTLLTALIEDWRKIWGPVPFIYAQLPNFMEPTTGPAESGWADLRDQQRKTLSVPGTGMAVAIDLGDWNDIHPENKKDLGHRLVLAALKTAYGQDIVSSGPMYAGMKVEGGKAVLSFTSVGCGLAAGDGAELCQFTIAGADGIYHSAKAEIRGDEVLVSSPDVPEPLHVRYAWASNPQGANLCNKNGLPASPFQADMSSGL